MLQMQVKLTLSIDVYVLRHETQETLHVWDIRECGSTLYVGMAQGVLFSLYIYNVHIDTLALFAYAA